MVQIAISSVNADERDLASAASAASLRLASRITGNANSAGAAVAAAAGDRRFDPSDATRALQLLAAASGRAWADALVSKTVLPLICENEGEVESKGGGTQQQHQQREHRDQDRRRRAQQLLALLQPAATSEEPYWQESA